MLREAGFETSQPCDVAPSSFEVAARREKLLLLKFLSSADELAASVSAEMKRLSVHLGGSPLVVAERWGREVLRRGVVYRRHGIPSVDPGTLAESLLDGSPPLAFAAPGGPYVRLDGAAIRRRRLELGLSLGDLAARLGVSRRTVQKYEQENMGATLEKAVLLEQTLQMEVARPQDLTLWERDAEGASAPRVSDRRLRRLRELGFEVHPAEQAPFDAVLLPEGEGGSKRPREERPLLVGVGEATPRTYRRARITGSISAVAKTASAFFVSGVEPSAEQTAGETVLLSERDLERAWDAQDLRAKIEELRT